MGEPITVTLHAAESFNKRTGRRDLVDSLMHLEKNISVRNNNITWYNDPNEVINIGFNITRYNNGDRFGVWKEDIINEKMCVIVNNKNRALTILPLNIYDVPVRKCSVGDNGRMKIRKRKRD